MPWPCRAEAVERWRDRVMARALLGPTPMPGAGSIEELRAEIARLATRVEQLEARALAAPPDAVRAAPRLPAADREAESRLGSYWAARFGMVSLVTGLALFIACGVDRMGPAGRVAIGYALGLLLGAVGRRVERRTPGLGRILIAGGLGVGYFTTYAMHHVPAV